MGLLQTAIEKVHKVYPVRSLQNVKNAYNITPFLFLDGKLDMLLRNNQTYIVIHIPQVFIVDDEILIHIRTDHVAVMITLVDQVDDMSADDTLFLIIAHGNMPWLDCKHDLQFLIVNHVTMCI